MRPRTTWPASTSANGASTCVGRAGRRTDPTSNAAISSRQVGVVVDVLVAAAGELLGVEQLLLTEPRLDPGVEPGAEPRGRRRRPRHRPGQVAGEGRPGPRAAAASAVADRLDGSGTSTSVRTVPLRLLEQPGQLVVPLLTSRSRRGRGRGPVADPRRARPSRSCTSSAAASRRNASAVSLGHRPGELLDARLERVGRRPSPACPATRSAPPPVGQRVPHRLLVRRRARAESCGPRSRGTTTRPAGAGPG